MTLKELRISKGLNQAQCASYLGMSTRNYQNYENDEKMVNTSKFHYIYNKLSHYSDDNLLYETNHNFYYNTFNTSVIMKDNLISIIGSVSKLKKRFCFKSIEKYLKEQYLGKVCILYGLRRTGKTTLLFQAISSLPLDEVAYIKVRTNNNMSHVIKDLEKLNALGIKYVFIDEITLLEDFINTASVLSDVFSMMGMKIIISGTDSLGFEMANRNELYDRTIMIHTSYISFKEYSYILNIHDIDKYIEYGGTLKQENMNFDDPDSESEEVAFRDDESTRKYIDTSISRNIQHSLKYDSFGNYFNLLRKLYDENELTNVINRVVQNLNHQFVLRVIEEKFKSHDLGSSRELLLHDYPKATSTVLYEINEEEVIIRLKKLINVIDKENQKVQVTEEHLESIKKYLEMLDIIESVTEKYESSGINTYHIITQPGMRYAITKALVYSLLQDDYFSNISEVDKTYIINKILSDIKGRMLEDIVLLDKVKTLSNEYDVFKFKFDGGGEYDMVIYNKTNNTCSLYEIKHSDKINARQYQYLVDNVRLSAIEKRFGKITGKYVLYKGAGKELDNNITYINVEEYLCR